MVFVEAGSGRGVCDGHELLQIPNQDSAAGKAPVARAGPREILSLDFSAE
jgi:hypothetical protein